VTLARPGYAGGIDAPRSCKTRDACPPRLRGRHFAKGGDHMLSWFVLGVFGPMALHLSPIIHGIPFWTRPVIAHYFLPGR